MVRGELVVVSDADETGKLVGFGSGFGSGFDSNKGASLL